MVYFKVVFVCALVAAVSGQSSVSSTTRRPSLALNFQNALNSLGGSAKSAVGLFNSTGQTFTKVANDGVQGFTNAGKSVINTVSGMKSSALQGGVNMFKQGVDIGTNMAGIIPGMSGVASMVGGMAKAGADVGNMVGQTKISLGSGIANGKMELVSGLSGAGAGLASSGINMASNMANSGIDTGIEMAKGAVGTIGNVIDNAADYVIQGSGKLSTLASTTADRMSVSAGSIPSSLNLQVGASTSG